MMRSILAPATLAATCAIQGCGIGYNSLLFVTKSNIGIDIDTQPPTAELAISRVEGVVEPTFEDGRTLPVMASFRPKSRGLFTGGVEQTFATGTAAAVMATLYGDATGSVQLDGNETWEEAAERRYGGQLSLDNPPELPSGKSFLSKEVRPVFFGTSTSLGLKVSWSGMTATVPDSVHVGYRRKEFAWAPIAVSKEKVKEKEKHIVRTPSLLATISFEGDVASPNKVSGTWLQYFATGRAATALALRQEVRRPMIKRLDPSATFSSIADVDAAGEQALLPLTNMWPQIKDDEATAAKFNAAAAGLGFVDFEDFASGNPTAQQVAAVRAALEADGVQFE